MQVNLVPPLSGFSDAVKPSLPVFRRQMGSSAALCSLMIGCCCRTGMSTRPCSEVTNCMNQSWLPVQAVSIRLFTHTGDLVPENIRDKRPCIVLFRSEGEAACIDCSWSADLSGPTNAECRCGKLHLMECSSMGSVVTSPSLGTGQSQASA